MSTGSALAVVLAEMRVDESEVTPGLLGFIVVALLGVATVLLIRSMNRRLRRIDLPDEEPAGSEPAPDSRPPAG